jgi:hypothetical protein
MAALISTLLKAQADAQLAQTNANHANLIAFQTATAQTLAAKGGDKESKLTTAKKRILQACAGVMHADEFMAEQVYQDMDAEGGASEGSFGNGSAKPLQDQGTCTLCHRDLNLPVTVTRRANAKVRRTINFFVLTSEALPSLLVPFG